MLATQPGIRRLCRLAARGPRILCYHGVCDDRVAGEPWVPDYFVSASCFAEQMKTLTRLGRVVSLADAVRQCGPGTIGGRPRYVVTFDDVAACTCKHALPVLQHHGICATFFVATGHADRGTLFAADVLYLLRNCDRLRSLRCHPHLSDLVDEPPRYKALPIETLDEWIGPVEQRVRRRLNAHMVETLRPMNWSEVQHLDRLGHEIGGHTVDHAILGSQSRATRRRQIADCITHIRKHIGKQPLTFAYPNGGPGDFDAYDKQVLADYGVRLAASTRPGSCSSRTDLLDLPRITIGKFHKAAHFRAELAGVLDRRHQRQQGWL